MKVKELKLDLGAGQNPREGFESVDFYAPGVKHKVDLLRYPWKFKSNSVDEAHCSHFFEHVPQQLRPKFMEELYRIMKPEAKATFICPYWSSRRAIQDFTHQWPPIAENTFLYFNKNWREQNKLNHGPYAVRCDFDFTYSFLPDQDVIPRAHESQAFMVKHYTESVSDIQLVLTKRP